MATSPDLFDVLDPEGNVVATFDENDVCAGRAVGEFCGGCGRCELQRAHHYGWRIEKHLPASPAEPKGRDIPLSQSAEAGGTLCSVCGHPERDHDGAMRPPFPCMYDLHCDCRRFVPTVECAVCDVCFSGGNCEDRAERPLGDGPDALRNRVIVDSYREKR